MTETERIYNLTPSTVEEHMLCYLVKNGFFAKDAYVVLDEYKKDCPEMEGRWNDLISDYPSGFIVVIRVGINSVALEYIEKNIPKAWFKSLFEN